MVKYIRQTDLGDHPDVFPSFIACLVHRFLIRPYLIIKILADYDPISNKDLLIVHIIMFTCLRHKYGKHFL